MRRACLVSSVLIVVLAAPIPGGRAQSPALSPNTISYQVSFPEPEHHWMQVEATFTRLAQQALDVRMSRSSPGRYAVSEFAKNVFSVEAFGGAGQKLTYSRPDADVWRVGGHDGTVRVVYKVFGDYANGTYFGVDTTHAHLNMPAAFMWGVGLEDRPIRIAFAPPVGSGWKVGTQLYGTDDPHTFTAPNLQYFMDSPAELADFLTSAFSVPSANRLPASFRLVVHGSGSQADVDALARLVERVAREQMAVFGEFPIFEPGQYTFLLDYVDWSSGDGMEHRNSTFISNPGQSIATPEGREDALDAISHELFHAWNIERIRPVGLEPFDFTRQNVTCCLWLGEGFTQYYGRLLLTRLRLDGREGPPVFSVVELMNTPGRAVRSPVQMSEYAPFADGSGSFVDPTDASRTFLSYYSYGAGIALALDFSLRDLSGGKLSLDDYMRVLWVQHGRPGGSAPGLVSRPYSLRDLREHLATLSGNQRFADEFFDRYIEGREAPDFRRLLALAGYTLRSANEGRAWAGNVSFTETANGLIVGVSGRGSGRFFPVPFDTPAYEAGLDTGDTITAIDGRAATLSVWNGLASRKPGEQVTLRVVRRGGATITRTMTLRQDPTVFQVVSLNTLTPAQKTFRDAWLVSRAR